MATAEPNQSPKRQRKPRKPKDLGSIPELDALTPRRKAFVLGYADPASPTFGNATQSMVAAGAPNTNAVRTVASQTLAIPSVQESVQSIFRAAGIDGSFVAERLRHFATDSNESWKRAPAVRAVEIAARAIGVIGAETQVNTMTVVLSENERSSLEARLLELEAGN